MIIVCKTKIFVGHMHIVILLLNNLFISAV